MENEAQTQIAYLLGRAIAAEKAIQTLIASRHQDSLKLDSLLQTNLGLRRDFLAQDLERAGLSVDLLEVAKTAYAEATRAVLRGVSSRKYVVPGWKERRP